MADSCDSSGRKQEVIIRGREESNLIVAVWLHGLSVIVIIELSKLT